MLAPFQGEAWPGEAQAATLSTVGHIAAGLCTEVAQCKGMSCANAV